MQPSRQIQSSSSSPRIQRWQMMSIAHFHICKAQRPIEQLIILLLHSNTSHHWRPGLIPLKSLVLTHAYTHTRPDTTLKRSGLEEPKHDRHTTQPADFNSRSAGTHWFLILKCKFNGPNFLKPVGCLIGSPQRISNSRHPVWQRPSFWKRRSRKCCQVKLGSKYQQVMDNNGLEAGREMRKVALW